MILLPNRELQENLVRSHSAGDAPHYREQCFQSWFHFKEKEKSRHCEVPLVRLGARRSLVSRVVVCRCGEPAEPRKDPHAARSEDQRSGQRAQWNFPGNPAGHDPGLQRYSFSVPDSGINSEDGERVILSPNSFGPCSVVPLLCPREGNGGRQRRPGPSVSPGPGADGRGQNVVPQERLGRCKICKPDSEEHAGSAN